MSGGMVFLIAIIIAVLFGGGAYAYMNNKATKEKKDLNDKITELNNKITTLEKAATTATTTATTTPSSTSATTADETANWKTYTSADFSFKYPSDYLTKDVPGNSAGEGEYGVKVAPSQTELDKGKDFSWFEFDKTTNPTAINNIKSEAKNGTVGSYTVTATSTTVGGFGATKAVFKSSTIQGFTEIIVDKSEVFLYVFRVGDDSTDKQKVLDNIIRTVTFK